MWDGDRMGNKGRGSKGKWNGGRKLRSVAYESGVEREWIWKGGAVCVLKVKEWRVEL